MKQEKREQLKFDSKAVYYAPEEASQSITAPIYMSSSFQYDAEIYQRMVDGERKTVNIYGRCGNPSEYQFEEQMAIIEGADDCLATASGMAAISIALFGLLKSGDHIVCDWTTYSSTHEMLDHRLTDYGITTTFVDTADLTAVSHTGSQKYYHTPPQSPFRVLTQPARASWPPSCWDWRSFQRKALWCWAG